MAKRLSEKDKKNIEKYFCEGKTIDELSKEFDCTKLTISRNLRKNLGDIKYKEIFNKRKKNYSSSETKNSFEISDNHLEELPPHTFTEIIPLNFEIENTIQKDLSSVPISDVDFPNVVFMVVDKKIELETKYVRDYPDWQFLSEEELNRKTIEIFNDIKTAKRFCNREQKVIKVPNTNVFKIVSPLLLKKGISRIVNAEKLIAL